MAILSKIKSAAKKIVKNVVTGAKGVASIVGSALTGNKNTASLQGAYIPGSLQKANESKTISAAKDVQTYNQQSTAGGNTISAAIGGNRNTLSGSDLSSLQSGFQSKLPVTINSGQQKISSNNTKISSPTIGLTSGLSSSEGSAPALRTISSANVGGTSSITSGGLSSSLSLPGAPVSYNPGKVDNTGLSGSLAGYYTRNADGTFTSVPQETDEQIVEKQKKLYDEIVGKKQDVFRDREVRVAREEKQKIQQALLAPTAELNAVIAKQNQDLLQLRQTGSQEGVTEAVYGGQQNAINYNAAIRALPLQASIAGLQGQLELAQDYLTELTQIKREQINNQYEYNKNLFNSIEGVLSKKDQRAYEELKTQNERQYGEQQNLIKTQGVLLQSALSQGASQSIINSINNADTVQKAIMAAGKYAGNILQQRTDEVQYNNAVLQGQKIKAEIESNKPITGEYASIINGVAGLVPSASKQIYKTNIANAIANGDFVTAYAEIGNAVEEKLTGEPKTKFANARNDIGIMVGMRDAIKSYADAGGDMGLLKGTEEKIKKNLGIDSGKASVLATQLWREFQTYRSNMTGAAFSPAESRDYASVNPTLGKSLDLNISVIDGAINQLTNRVTSTINARLPEAQKIYSLMAGENQQATSNSSGIDYTATLDSIFK